MVNHIRTLLLNLEAIQDPKMLDEYIDRDYKVIELPIELKNIHVALFGNADTRHSLNYRVRQLMLILHNTDLEYYVYKLDPRVTYMAMIAKHMTYTEPKDVPPLQSLLTRLEMPITDAENTFIKLVADDLRQVFTSAWHDLIFINRLAGALLLYTYSIETLRQR